jgi:4-amino-4-deoxy-L-arabinose transferase-like glycosyltransferase
MLLATVVAVVAVTLRFWRLTWGLADGTRFPDEMIFSLTTARFVPLSWASFEMRTFTYPALYTYLAGVATAAAYALGLHPDVPNGFSTNTVLVLRVVSGAAGVAGVGLVGVLGAWLYGSRWVGLAAAALLAVAPLHAMHSHIAATDELLTSCMTLALLAAYVLAQRGSVPAAVAAGMAVGLSFAAKQPGLVALAPVGWAVLEAGLRARSVLWLAILGLTAAGSSVAAYAAFCPPCVLHWDQMLAVMQMHHALNVSLGMGFTNNHLVASLGWYGRPYVYQLVATLPYSLGWPLYALALVGIGMAMWRHGLADRILLAFMIPYFVQMSGGHTVFPRFMLPLFPALVVLAARAVCEPVAWRGARVAVFAAVFAYTLALTATQVARFSGDQQREIARFVVEHVARPDDGGPIRVGVPCVLKGLDYFQIARPLGTAGLAYLPLEDGHWFDDHPDVLVLPEWKEIGYRRDLPGSPAEQALDRLQSGAAGYRFERRWRSSYLQRDFYTWLDPAFAADLWQGEIGFSVYVRE